MRKHVIWASAILALVISACGSSTGASSASPTPGCANPGAAHRAYVVVEHLSKASFQKCVGFSGDTIDGQALMDQSGVKFQTQTFSFGKAVCQIDSEPAQYSACFAQGQPFWALFVETNSTWAVAQTGYTQVTLHDKEALGWRFVASADAASPPPPPLAQEG